jgi:hypothetical protein
MKWIIAITGVLVIGVVGIFADENSSIPTKKSVPAPTQSPIPTPTSKPILDKENSAGSEVIISDIRNDSALDGDGTWFWAASFKTNTANLTKTDCVVKALNKSGKVIGETSYRGTTNKDGRVIGKDYVESSKEEVLAIKSFDIKCTLVPTTTEKASFSISITSWQIVNPASGYAVFTIRNIGEVTGEPVCRIKVEDESGTYKGTGWIIGVGEIKPGAKFESKKLLTIKKQGASYVSKSSGSCSSG